MKRPSDEFERERTWQDWGTCWPTGLIRLETGTLQSRLFISLAILWVTHWILFQSSQQATLLLVSIQEDTKSFSVMINSGSNSNVDMGSSQKQVSTLNTPRNVAFLAESDWTKPKEVYSGMWWQTTQHFLETEWVHFNTLETPSFKAFQGGRVRKTRDWLDLSVTRLSGYFKHVSSKGQDHDEDKSTALAHIGNHLDDYVNKTAIQYQVPAESSAAPDTLAVLPFVAVSQDTSDLVNKALNATLASLWQAGIGRCVVVVGGSQQLTLDAETNLVESIFESMHDKLDQSPMQLSIVTYDSLPQNDRLMMPRVALRGLQLAMRGNLSLGETNEWLGEEDWKYVLFTEPDLVLHARPSAMADLKREMDRGSVLSGHRFQPIPHQSNLPDYRRPDQILPSNFSEVVEVDPSSEDHSCCDVGEYYLSQTARHNHGKIREYSLLRIKDFTVFPLIDSHQRTCIISKSSTPCG